MNEVVAVMISENIITNIPAEIVKAAIDGTITRYLTRGHMQLMAAFDLGQRWTNLANGPTLFLQDADGAIHPVTHTRKETTITDDFGNYWPRYCSRCGGAMQVVRPGEARCPKCDP